MKKIVFLTGTRADFGKLKSLIKISQDSDEFDVSIFVTGMHMNKKYGLTVEEITKSGFKNIYKFINHSDYQKMEITLSETINGFSNYVNEYQPDLIILHGDRVEALAGSIVGSLNNILVAHIEGGEISGTIDELIRHSVSKLSHIHLVANELAKNRLIQMGEYANSIHIIGSPDLDLMKSKKLPLINDVKKHYDINFDNYAIGILHPVTTEKSETFTNTSIFVDALIESELNYILIYPNNDSGSSDILINYKKFEKYKRIKIFPSIRFESFLSLLKNSDFIIGNSSTGIREAPYFNIPTINIGTRQNKRSSGKLIRNISFNKKEIIKEILNINNHENDFESKREFGNGDSDKLFLKLLRSNNLWEVDHQKQFQDL